MSHLKCVNAPRYNTLNVYERDTQENTLMWKSCIKQYKEMSGCVASQICWSEAA